MTLVGVNYLAYLLITRQALPAHWFAQVGIAAAAAVSGAWVFVHQHRHWTRPARQLLAAVQQVRDGQLPIDALATIGGGLTPVVELTQDLLRDLRQQRADYAELQQELRQRVANRTEALERQVGTLKQQASRDILTGLHNRRLLDDHLPKLVERCVAERVPLAVLMIDVDHFKPVNDTLGHAAGDKLLTDVGHLIRSSVREQDMAFRFGGDEFVIVLPGQARGQAEALASRLTSLMDQLTATLKVANTPRLSIGIATLADCPHATAGALLTLADQRLYQLKHARRPAAA